LCTVGCGACCVASCVQLDVGRVVLLVVYSWMWDVLCC